MDHVYAGSRFQAEVMWKDAANTQYFATLRDYHEQVVIEVVGHDHFSDLRYHSSFNVCDLPDTDVEFNFHNLLVSPGVTPRDGSNPGVTTFEITEDLVPQNLRMEFLNLNDTLSESPKLTWNSVDFAQVWGLKQLDAPSLDAFRKTLEQSEEYTNNYLVSKLGFDYNDPVQYEMAMQVLTDNDIVSSPEHNTATYLCQMHQSTSPAEY